MIRASAPGKLMLAGEYVVVERATPALSIAVDRRVEVDAEALDGSAGWRITSDTLNLRDATLDKVPVIAEALARVPGAPRAGRLTVRSQLGAGADKPGLGSSAALCVASYAAFARLAGLNGLPDLAPLIAAHRASQGGRGSGFDVASCLHGGLIVFMPVPDRPDDPPRVERIPWPKGLHAAVFKTRKGASTVHMLARMASWRDEDPETLDACLDPLAIETEELVSAFRVGDVDRLLTACAQVQEELGVLDRLGEVGILPSGVLQLHGVIEDAGCVGRTSGAGGGDCVWALSDDPRALERAAVGAKELGFERLELQLAGPGLRVDEV